MSSCFGRRKTRDEEREPLLPQYQDDTALQRRLHQKLHTYQMLRAMTLGFMPSNEQAVVNLRTLLALDVLNPTTGGLSDSGRLLVKYTRQFVDQLITLLLHKNSQDAIQDFLWFLSQSRLHVDLDDLGQRASKAKARADTAAAYKSLKTVTGLLLTNADFRIFVSDLQTVGREVFKDSAFALSKAADDAAKKIDAPSLANGDQTDEPPTKMELAADAKEVAVVAGKEGAAVAQAAGQSLAEHLSGEERETLINRLKRTVLDLRKRTDYSDSVSTIGLLIRRYARAYSRVAEEVAEAAREDVVQNEELDLAVKNFWSFISSFGDEKQWEELEARFRKVASHQSRNSEFESFFNELSTILQKILTDPEFLDHAKEKIEELRSRPKSGDGDELRQDAIAFLEQIPTTLKSAAQDQDVATLIKTCSRIFSVVSPANSMTNSDLFQDAINIFLPLAVQAVQYIPIPRLEVSVPEIDLLVENLIIEPGKTVNNSSFFPFKVRFETYNDIEIRKARHRTVSNMTSLVTVKLDGISMRAEDVGFWMRLHSGIFRLADEGIASFEFDERGIDIHLDVELGQERLEKIVSLKAVRVKIHKLKYNLRKSKFACLAWLLKPFLQPIIRKVMEKQLSTAIADAIHAANRELLYARERLRATRISDPDDLMTFARAVIARLTPPDDPDVYTRLGVAAPGKGIFQGVYAPGSVVKLWEEEGHRAKETIEDYERDGWRNDIFDTPVQA